MTGPDGGIVRLTWGGRSLALRYPLGAVKSLTAALGVSADLDAVSTLASKHLRADTLGKFVWAGLLHGQRDLTVAEVDGWVDWADGAVFPLYHAVVRAWELGLVGSVAPPPRVEDEKEASNADPKARTAGRGGWRFGSLRSRWGSRRRRSGGDSLSAT